jgi:hypothetical protein
MRNLYATGVLLSQVLDNKGYGGGEIRTHEAVRPSGFQDRRNQPLCHPSERIVINDQWSPVL